MNSGTIKRTGFETRKNVIFMKWRFYAVVFFVIAIVLGLVARLVDLTILKRHFLLNQGNARTLRVVTSPAFRGMISDRNGYPLAVSTEVFSIWVDPTDFSASPKQLKSLSSLLDIKPNFLRTHIQKNDDNGKEFIYIKRSVSPEIAHQIKALHIPGVNLQEDFKRYYPEGEIASHIIGFTNIDDKGEEGVELSFNQLLSGIPGKRLVLKDRIGREVNQIQNIQSGLAGKDVKLSIDRRLQYLAYRELLNGVTQNIAESGTVVILDVKTGEILAMVNNPSYNPNNRSTAKIEDLRNRAVTDVFEPGSTMKAFSVATALSSGMFKPDSVVNTYPGWISLDHHLVRDEHSVGPMSLTKILQISSNVGITKVMLQLPPNKLWETLHAVGFGEETDVGLPGERSGQLYKRPVWKPFALATLSFGYGLSVTALQLAHAYATIANDGVKIPLTILKTNEMPRGKQVIDKAVAQEMLVMLQTVLAEGGSGTKARIPGYSVAGKTGTAKIAGKHGYAKHLYVSSFVGIAPASNPRLVVAVVIHEPKGKMYYGGDVSGPVFQKIMQGSLRILDIPPDDMASLNKSSNAA